MDAYIISYFGKGQLSYKRQGLHYQQLSVLLKDPHIDHIHILSMGYQDHAKKDNSIRPADALYLPHERITYHDHKLVPPSQARNALIDVFNATSKPWGLFLDNDAYLDARYQGTTVIPTLEQHADLVSKYASCLSVKSPRHHPFKGKLDEAELKIDTHLWLAKINYLKTTAFFLQNRSYYNMEPIYFNSELAELEDWEYVGRVIDHASNVYLLEAVLMIDLGISETDSTLFQDKERTDNFEDIRESIYQYYKPKGLKRNQNGRIQWGSMDTMNNPSTIWLPYDADGDVSYTRDFSFTLFDKLFEEE